MTALLALCIATLVIARTTRRRPIVLRETPVISSLPLDIGVPTIKRRGK